MAVYYKLANSGVIWEKIGDQIVMANLDSGRYCNVSEASGVVVWELMMMGCSLELIHQKMPQYFTNYDDFCINQVNGFLLQLVEYDFISVTTVSDVKTEMYVDAHLDKNIFPTVFLPPKLLSYDDIDTLLLLDPIDDYVEELMAEYEA